jgi:hypothetical protein
VDNVDMPPDNKSNKSINNNFLLKKNRPLIIQSATNRKKTKLIKYCDVGPRLVDEIFKGMGKNAEIIISIIIVF